MEAAIAPADADLGTVHHARRPARALGDCPIDRAHLARFTFGNEELELEVLELFAGQALRTLSELRGAADAKAWRDAAHALKGSARAVGAWRIASLAEDAERRLAMARAAERQPTLAELDSAVDEARAYVVSLAARPA